MTDFTALAKEQVTQEDIDSGWNPESLTSDQILIGTKRYFSKAIDILERKWRKAVMDNHYPGLSLNEQQMRFSIDMSKGSAAGRSLLPVGITILGVTVNLALVTSSEKKDFEDEASSTGSTLSEIEQKYYNRFRDIMNNELDIINAINSAKIEVDSGTTPDIVEISFLEAKSRVDQEIQILKG